MAQLDQKILFTALGFVAVILNDVPQDKQALRAKTIAKLIESFCMVSVPEAFEIENSTTVGTAHAKQLIERYIAELRDTGSAQLDYDRQTLLDIYVELLVQKVRHDHKEFFASGHEDMIANRILQLVEERLQWEQQS